MSAILFSSTAKLLFPAFLRSFYPHRCGRSDCIPRGSRLRLLLLVSGFPLRPDQRTQKLRTAKLIYPRPAPHRQPRRPAKRSSSPAEPRRKAARLPATPPHALLFRSPQPCPLRAPAWAPALLRPSLLGLRLRIFQLPLNFPVTCSARPPGSPQPPGCGRLR